MSRNINSPLPGTKSIETELPYHLTSDDYLEKIMRTPVFLPFDFSPENNHLLLTCAFTWIIVIQVFHGIINHPDHVWDYESCYSLSED